MDQCVCVRSVNNVKTILTVYLDGIVILSDIVKSMQEINDSLSFKFLIKI